MIECTHFHNNTCKLASSLAGIDVPVTEQACVYCQSHSNPMKANSVVAGISILELYRLGKPIPFALTQMVDSRGIAEGCGTELKNLISWFPIPKKTKCKSCRSLELKMNNWGPEKCQQKLPYILKKLRIAAMRRKIPFSESLASILVEKAIRNARKKTGQFPGWS